jgi:single-strand DNA-binding protein
MSRSLNKVELIGNLTRDPELRYTPQGTAVCTFGLATNRYWTTESGEKKEDVEFHRIVAWQKLAELCGQLLSKGRKVYVEGRLQTRKWAGQDGVEKSITEVVINDMIILDSRGVSADGGSNDFDIPDDSAAVAVDEASAQPAKAVSAKKKDDKKSVKKEEPKSEDASEDIPF